jgi:hypothetical protein
LAISKLQRQIRRLVCSAPWFEACWSAIAVGRVKARQRLDVALDNALLYPPGGSPRAATHPTLMKRCKRCGGKWYPPQYVRGCGICEDCSAAENLPLTSERNHVSSTHSITAEALQQLGHYRVRLVEPRLAAEDEQSLLKEIAAYNRRASAPKTSFAHPNNTKKH